MTVTVELAVLLQLYHSDFMGHFVNNKETEQRELLNGQALVWDV